MQILQHSALKHPIFLCLQRIPRSSTHPQQQVKRQGRVQNGGATIHITGCHFVTCASASVNIRSERRAVTNSGRGTVTLDA